MMSLLLKTACILFKNWKNFGTTRHVECSCRFHINLLGLQCHLKGTEDTEILKMMFDIVM